MSDWKTAPGRKGAAWGTGLIALAVSCVMAVGGTLFALESASAQNALPHGSSGRVHYDHYRDRGGDRWHHRDRRPGWDHRRSDRRDQRPPRRDDRGSRGGVIIQGDRGGGSASGGTFSGNVSAYRDRGNGTYVYIEGERGAPPAPAGAGRSPGPRVIQPGSATSGCADESGVCVIRPGQ